MNDKVKIEKIVIRIGDKQAELTVEDAKALRDVLDQMFGKEKEYVPYYPTTWPWYPWKPWYAPTITWGAGYTNTDNGETVITYNGSSGGSCFRS